MGIGAGLYMYDVVVRKFTFAISSPDKFLFDTVSTYITRSEFNNCRNVYRKFIKFSL